MKTTLFIFDIMLIMVFVCACTINVTAYCKTKHVRQLLSGVLMFFFCLDSTIIFMSDFLYDIAIFAGPYNVLTYFGGKAICGIAISALYLYRVTEQMERKMGVLHLLVLVPLACVTVYIGDLNASVKQHWIFYTIRQVYLAGFNLYYLFLFRRSYRMESEKGLWGFKGYLVLGVIFAGLIFLEDSLVIFHFQYVINTLNWKIFREHNVSENIFFVILAILSMKQEFTFLIRQKEGEQEQEPELVLLKPEPAPKETFKDPFAEKYGLSNRQRDVLYLLVRDKTYQEMGEELGLSVGTVKFHAHGIYDKTDSKNRSELIQKYQGFYEESQTCDQNREECRKPS